MFAGRRFVELTMPTEEGMPTFMAPWHPLVEISLMGRHGYEGRQTHRIVFGTHTGTHMDAPLHFIPGGRSIDQVPLEMMIGQATVLDMSGLEDKHEVSLEELKQALAGRPVERLILGFGWDRMAGQLAYFYDHPFLSEEAASWLVEQGCRLLAVDTPQPDNPVNGRGSPKDGVVHKILLNARVALVEYIINVPQIKAEQCTLVVAPLRVARGDGAPARCFSIV